MRIKTLLFLILLGLIASPLHAIELYREGLFSLDLQGYYKNLVFSSKRAATNNPMTAEINRIRTEWGFAYSKVLSAKVTWDNELVGGDYVNSEEFAARQTARNEPYLDMDYELVRRNNFFYGQSFYRAYAKLDPGPFQLTVGRQKVDWGIMKFFSPGDLFERLPIFDVEKGERVGATAANLNVPVGSRLRLNPVYAFNPDFDRSRIGGRITQTVGRFDLSALGGRFLRDRIFGFDFTGDIHKAGIRGEFIYDWADVGRNFFQAATGVDYGFENTFYFALEYFFNGQGTNDATTITPFPATANQIKSVHQHFIGLLLKYDLSPLWALSMENVVDPNGGSVFLNPESRYSFFEWLEVTFGLLAPVGKGGGEFTATPSTYYAQTVFYF